MDLDTYLRESGTDAAAFAERVGLTPASISRIRRGEQNITRETIRQIVEATGGAVTAEALVFGGVHAAGDTPAAAGLSAGKAREISGGLGQ